MIDRRLFIASGCAAFGLAKAPDLFAQLGGAQLPIQLSPAGATRAFKMHPKIAIASYPIRFIRAAEGNAGGRVGIFLTLDGPSEEDMRQLAVEARDDLSNRLTMALKMVLPPEALLAEPSFAAMPKVAGGAKWDAGTLDPMGKRYWYITGSPKAPLLEGWGSTDGGRELSLNNRMTVPSRALDAVFLIPNLTLEFSTLSGSVKSGSKGSTAWAGGEILFGFKPHSQTLFMAGGKRSIEMVGGWFVPKGRILISPTPIPGQIVANAGALSPEMAKQMGNGRHDALRVDVAGWRELVRMAFRGYNQSLVDNIVKASA